MTILFARSGEKVTRESGEYICTVAHDLFRNSIVSVSDLKDWQVRQPMTHERLPQDSRGKQWIRDRNTFLGWGEGVDLHLERGWASETSAAAA